MTKHMLYNFKEYIVVKEKSQTKSHSAILVAHHKLLHIFQSARPHAWCADYNYTVPLFYVAIWKLVLIVSRINCSRSSVV